MPLTKLFVPLAVALFGAMLSIHAKAEKTYTLDSVAGLQAYDVALEAVNYKPERPSN